MDYFHSKESINTASSGQMWVNITKPILTNNHHKYLRELSSKEIEIFETVAGSMLSTLGYSRLTDFNIEISPEMIEEFNGKNQIKIRQSLLLASDDDIAKRRPQEELLASIQAKKSQLY